MTAELKQQMLDCQRELEEFVAENPSVDDPKLTPYSEFLRLFSKWKKDKQKEQEQ